MMRNRITFLITLCFLFQQTSYSAPLAVPLNLTQASLDSLKIGVVAAVTGSVTIGGKDQAGRIVQSGEPVYIGDTVSTDSAGTLQILLLDETVFTIGPTSAIMIDKFIYDPATESGQVNAKVVKGVFRFVTGKIGRKRPSDMNVDLPSGSIGVRGTIVSGEVIGNKSTVILLGPGVRNNTNSRIGQITVSNQVGNEFKQVTVTRPGYGTVIDGSGVPPSAPFQIPDQDVQRISGALETKFSNNPNDPNNLGGKEGDPTKQSGQERAGAREPLRNSNRAGGFLQKLSRESDKAAQVNLADDKKIKDGVARFDELRRIQTGIFHYTQTSVPLRIVSTGAASGDTYSFDMDINFGARTVGGSVANNKIAVSSSGGAVYNLAQKNFGNDGDIAVFSFLNVPRSSGSCTACGNADILVGLNNKDVVIGDNAKHSILFNDGGNNQKGEGTTPSRT